MRNKPTNASKQDSIATNSLWAAKLVGFIPS
jgi:hypothetical protein